MRSLFVNHEEKETIIVDTASGEHTLANWRGILDQFADALEAKTVAAVRAWIEPDFSTTTQNDRLIARTAFMGVLQKYFSYECHIECGLPKVTLEGTVTDWERLLQKVQGLANFADREPQGLAAWQRLLEPIVQQFIASAQGAVDEDFWQALRSRERRWKRAHLSVRLDPGLLTFPRW